jgi:hypothetical protein
MYNYVILLVFYHLLDRCCSISVQFFLYLFLIEILNISFDDFYMNRTQYVLLYMRLAGQGNCCPSEHFRANGRNTQDEYFQEVWRQQYGRTGSVVL